MYLSCIPATYVAQAGAAALIDFRASDEPNHAP